MLRWDIRHDPDTNDAVMRGTWRTSMATLITGSMEFIVQQWSVIPAAMAAGLTDHV